MKAATVRFGRRLVRLFAAASGDDHPLHTSRELSRLTPYGEPIVYGILQGLAALGAVRQEPGWILWGVGFDFLGSAVPGVDYGLEVERLAEDRVRVRIQDGRLPVMTANVAFGRPGEAARGGAGAAAPEGAGWRTKGAYRPDREALSAVMAATGLDQPWITPGHVAALMWASHLVGVEQRHERVFLVGVKALFGEPPEGEGFDGEAWVERTGGRGEIVLAGRFGVAGSAFGSLRVGAARLASPPAPDGDRLRALLGGPAPGAAGGMALVIGGSRGLGAALARGLALRGYRVLATYSRGAGPAAEEAGIELLQGTPAATAGTGRSPGGSSAIAKGWRSWWSTRGPRSGRSRSPRAPPGGPGGTWRTASPSSPRPWRRCCRPCARGAGTCWSPPPTSARRGPTSPTTSPARRPPRRSSAPRPSSTRPSAT